MKKKKVMIGMSGGVDSSVAAYLLKKQGYDVIGVFMKLWEGDEDKEVEKACCSLSAAEDARLVANKIDIPFYVLNFKKSFKNKVVDYFVEEYLQGKTPNPCIACNKYIKFDELLKKALMLECDYVATGHYAKIEFDEESNRYRLLKSKTDKKDQTYALYNLTQEQLKHTLLPLGEYEKDEIRKIAKEQNLITANKPDSQEICFVEDGKYFEFIENYTNKKIKIGDFVDKDENKIGKHSGIVNYTIGQRKGLGLALGRPAYVINIDANDNRVVIGDNKDLFKKELIAKDLNYIYKEKLEDGMEVMAKIRYNGKPEKARVYNLENNILKVVFEKEQRAITPGQSLVLYKQNYVLGGGIIIKAL